MSSSTRRGLIGVALVALVMVLTVVSPMLVLGMIVVGCLGAVLWSAWQIGRSFG